jgi:environmental stress-induced protein Ves
MAVSIFTSKEFVVSEWSGGKTVQYWIFPANSSLAQRDFRFRISSAVVEVDESEFSVFEGYQRKLMVLNGELELIHDGHHSVLLKPFDQDTFFGSWKTLSKGRAQDLNVIFHPDIRVDMDHHRVTSGDYLTLHATKESFVVVHQGAGSIKGTPFREGELIRIVDEQLSHLHADEDLELVVIRC